MRRPVTCELCGGVIGHYGWWIRVARFLGGAPRRCEERSPAREAACRRRWEVNHYGRPF